MSTSVNPHTRPESAAVSPPVAPSLKGRILAAAKELFYAQGIRAVGVEAIAAAAGTNKMTLYRHFASKDDLVVEYLRAMEVDADAAWDAMLAKEAGNPKAQLLAWIRVFADGAHGSERGCAFANAAVELTEESHPGRRIVEEHKHRQQNRLVGLCRAAGIADADRVADQVFLLIEGAQISVQSLGTKGPGSRLLALAEDLITLHLERGRPRTRRSPRRA